MAVVVLVVFGSLIRLRQLGHNLFEEHSFRQTQTAFAVREFARNGIDLSTSPLPIFGQGASVPMEFPLFQALAALLVPFGLDATTASRLLGLISFQVAAVLLVALMWRFHGRGTAIAGLTLYELSPFGLFWGAASLIEFFAVALALGMVLATTMYLEHGGLLWLLLGAMTAVGAFLVKLTTAPCWTLLLVFVIWRLASVAGWRATIRRSILPLAVGPVLGLVVGYAWSKYGDSVKEENPVAFVWTSHNLSPWNFGTSTQRFDPSQWATISGRVADSMAGPLLIGLLLAVLAAVLASRSEERIMTTGLLVVVASGPLVFFNLYFVHEYYLAAIFPAIIAASAVGVTWLAGRLGTRAWQRAVLGMVATTAILASTLTTPLGNQRYWDLRHVNEFPLQAATIANNTEPSDRVIVIGCGMDPTFLYLADRQGQQFYPAEGSVLAEQVRAVWDREPIADYRYLFRCDEQLDPSAFLPDGYSARPLGGELFEVGPIG